MGSMTTELQIATSTKLLQDLVLFNEGMLFQSSVARFLTVAQLWNLCQTIKDFSGTFLRCVPSCEGAHLHCATPGMAIAFQKLCVTWAVRAGEIDGTWSFWSKKLPLWTVDEIMSTLTMAQLVVQYQVIGRDLTRRAITKQYRMIAFGMGGHARLGSQSLVGRLDTALLPVILNFCSPTP